MLDFDNYKSEAIKIDTRPIYKSDAESDWFAAWRESGAKPVINEDWNKQIAERVANNARHIRIKLLDESNAPAFEIQKCAVQTIYPDQIMAGAEYRFMERADFYDLVAKLFPDGWRPNDFWLFDLTEGIEQFYTEDFAYNNAAPISAEDLPKYIALRNAVLQLDKLFDIEEFKKRYINIA
ncbi:MAG: hypothetical protein FWC51_03230 [Proteobacteria bacterium]|nr:hypothetical protein [Pseudomonadota bacterium]